MAPPIALAPTVPSKDGGRARDSALLACIELCAGLRVNPFETLSSGPYRMHWEKISKWICAFQSDEAHFWLNGYVNKQNCRIWSEANPQVYVETPLHPEKLTVWCALWAGGILQKR
ncbi:hypothetical protein TNCV_1873641 [Trichonephila clavipes]|nr:hypothetical protein TNCV_1873641 [Trichonephila clavipes]